MAEFALDALVAPGGIFSGEPFDHGGAGGVRGWATAAVGVGPPPGGQAEVPAQDCGGSDQAVPTQRLRQQRDEYRERGPVGPSPGEVVAGPCAVRPPHGAGRAPAHPSTPQDG